MKLEERIAEGVIKAVAKVFDRDVSEITRDTRFVEDLRAKSANIVALVALLQNEFGVMISLMEARRRKTVGEAIDYIISLRRQ